MRSLRIVGLGARLALSGGRTAFVRMILMSLGVAAGVTMLLGALSVAPARQAYDRREAARDGTTVERPRAVSDATLRWWTGTTFGDRPVQLFTVRGVGDAPVPPGLPRLPSAGEVFASPQLAALLSSPGGELLRPRIPGTVVGRIGPQGLLEPDELVAYVGASSGTGITGMWPPEIVTSFTPRPSSAAATDAMAILLLCLAVVSVLLPIGIFILTCTRLSASTREARLAAVRLSGGTQTQVRILAATEVAIAAVPGVLLALPAFKASQPAGSAILASVLGHGLFPSDFAPPLAAAVALIVLVPVFALGTALMTMRRVVVSPLGIARRATRSPPGWHWVVLLAVGLIGLALSAWRHEALLRQASPIPGIVIGAALVAVLAGMAGTGPWLASITARAICAARPGPSVLVGARRLEADPGSAGRVVMTLGVLVALAAVVQAIFLADANAQQRYVGPGVESLTRNEVVAQTYVRGANRAGDVWTRVRRVPGVESLVASRRLPTGGTCGVDCAATMETDGRPATVERIRNAIGWTGQAWTPAELRAETTSSDSSRIAQMLQLALLFVLLVTAANLLVATVDGMMERRRALAVLSAIGVPAVVLRRSVLVQVGLPLAAALGLGVSVGLAVTGLLFDIADEALVLPLRSLLVTAASAGGAVLVVSAVALPWIRIVRRPELLRSE